MSAPAEVLDTYANKGAPPLSKRALAWGRMGFLWDWSSLERLRKCRKVRRSEFVEVLGRREGGGPAGYAGLCTCGSVWACPVDSRRINAERALEIGLAVGLAHHEGWGVVFSTFTMRHRREHLLTDSWDAAQKALRRMMNTKAFRKEKERYGLVGFLVVPEVTDGLNGWHVHFHVLFFFRQPITEAECDALHARLLERWSAGLVSAGYPAPLAIAQDHRLVTDGTCAEIAEYLSKSGDPVRTGASAKREQSARGIGVELTGSAGKVARKLHGTYSPWAILDAAMEGDVDYLERWWAWEQGSKGRRQVRWSRGLREELGLSRERTDEEIVEEQVGDESLFYFSPDQWTAVVREPRVLGQLLDEVERGGIVAARKFLDTNAIGYSE